MTEDTMLQKLKKHKPEALEALIREYNAYVSSIITAVLGRAGTPQDVEELVSDVFVSMWNHADALKPGKVRAYIGASARNAAKSFLRKRQLLVMDADEMPTLADEDTPELETIKAEQRRLVYEAVLSMPHPDREIFLRYYYYLQTTGDIAKTMGMEPGTVRVRLLRGRNTLKKTLWKEDVL